MAFTIEVTNAAEVIETFSASIDAAEQAVTKAVQEGGMALVRKVQNEYLSGQALSTRSGRLKASIAPGHSESLSGLSRSGDTISFSVGTTVPYAEIWERTGSKAHTVTPKSASALRFIVGGSPIFAKYANIPAQAPRPFIAPALEDMAAELESAIAEAVTDAIQEKLK